MVARSRGHKQRTLKKYSYSVPFVCVLEASFLDKLCFINGLAITEFQLLVLSLHKT